MARGVKLIFRNAQQSLAIVYLSARMLDQLSSSLFAPSSYTSYLKVLHKEQRAYLA
jgi:uncharacterized ion transporter superfamily protein YfcC